MVAERERVVQGGVLRPGQRHLLAVRDAERHRSWKPNWQRDERGEHNTGNGFSVTQSSSYISNQNYLTAVGSFTGSKSYYGTYDQSGDVL